MQLHLALLALSSVAHATRVTYNWTLSKVSDINPDGLHTRSVLGINGQWPPVPINVNSTDELRIRLKNGLGNGSPTTLHSHGIFFNNTNYFDGASMITQCPIPDGQDMTYEILNSPRSPQEQFGKQWGTYWIHSHYRGQYADGFRIPLVIHHVDSDGVKKETHHYDDDYTVSLTDWYHQWYNTLNRTKLMTVTNPAGKDPVPKSHLIYFQHTPWNRPARVLPGFNENATLRFELGKTYRLRIANMASFAKFHFWIEGHQMKIIEVDGVDTEPFTVDHFSISVAQRVSVLVKARTDSHAKNWKIHAAAGPDMYAYLPDDLQMNVTSQISYGHDLEMGEGRKHLNQFHDFDETQLTPVDEIPLYGLTDHYTQSHRLDILFTTFKNGINYATFNNNTFIAPIVPAALTMKSEGEHALDPRYFGPNAHAITAKHLDTVEFVLYNWGGASHPFHLHGTNFQVVWRQLNVTSLNPKDTPPFNPHQSNPIRRDTVSVPPTGVVAIRFVSDNPGAWFFHCHIEWHLAAGLALIMIQAPDVYAEKYKTIPSEIYEQCHAQNMNTSGNAGGIKNSVTNFGNLPQAPRLNRTHKVHA